ncbi:hypothetical protein TKK_0014996 [Trichogramma kaykai]
MGKLSQNWNSADSDESIEKIKKRKRKNKLEEIRRNALAAKRNLRKKQAPIKQKAQSSFMKTLHRFASQRADIEEATNVTNLLNRKNNSKPFPDPVNVNGFFRRGLKGKLISRRPNDKLLLDPQPIDSQNKLREAVVNNDALKLMQTCSISHKPPEDKAYKIPPNIRKILQDFSDNSSFSSINSNNRLEHASPNLGLKGKKKVALLSEIENQEIDFNQKYPSPSANGISKKEKCIRRLFEDENNTSHNIKNSQPEHENLICNQNSDTPENIIYFTELSHCSNVDITAEKRKHDLKMKLQDKRIIQYYTETCKIISEKSLSVFKNHFPDPLQAAKTTLKTTYIKSFTDFICKEKNIPANQRIRSSNKGSVSSNSDILLEPDSCIARILEKNQVMFNKTSNHENNSILSEVDLDNIPESSVPVRLRNLGDPTHKRKRAASSNGNGSDLEIPSSTKVNSDISSTRMHMNMIDPQRQELVARYLKDVNTNNMHQKENSNRNVHREPDRFDSFIKTEKPFIGKETKQLAAANRNPKHVPSILRKNRPAIEGVSKEKTFIAVEKNRSSNPLKKSISQEFFSDETWKNEQSPSLDDLIPNEFMSAPKCKYSYMNAKYNQPPRINVPVRQNQVHQKNSNFERHLFPPSPPRYVENSFIVQQNFNPSPIRDQISCSQNSSKNFDFCNYQLSQGSSVAESNGMQRMVSFGDIQQRTDLLTLQSSQSQKCSQNSLSQFSNQDDYVFHSNHCQQPQVCNQAKNMIHSNHLCNVYSDVPDPRMIELLTQPSSQFSNSDVQYNVNQTYLPNDSYQVVAAKNQICSQQEQMIGNCMPVQTRGMSQPIKFMATGRDRLPVRRPIYDTKDFCTHVHKSSMLNPQQQQLPSQQQKQPQQQQQQQSRHCHQRDIVNIPHYMAVSSSTIQDCFRSFPQSSGNKVKVEKMYQIVDRNRPISSNYNVPIPNGNFIPTGLVSQTLVCQESMPVHTVVNNPRDIGKLINGSQQQQPPPPPSIYTQVGFNQLNQTNQHSHYVNSDEAYNQMNNVYIQQM